MKKRPSMSTSFSPTRRKGESFDAGAGTQFFFDF